MSYGGGVQNVIDFTRSHPPHSSHSVPGTQPVSWGPGEGPRSFSMFPAIFVPSLSLYPGPAFAA